MCPISFTAGALGVTSALSAGLAGALGGGTAATIGSGIVIGAGIGAVDGAILGASASAIGGGRGRDIGRAALIGAGTGAVTGGVTGGVSAAAPAATPVADVSPSLEAAQAESNALATLDDVANSGQPAMALKDASQAAGAGAGKSASGLSGETIAGMVLQGAGAGAQAYGEHQQGEMESKALKEQARLNRIRAGQAQEAAALEKIDLARRQRATIGRGKTMAASSGIMLEGRAEASPNVWEEDARAELAYEGSKIAHNANLQSWGYMQNANIDMMNARTARRTGNLKSATSLIKGGAGIYTTAYGKPSTSLFA